MADYPYRTESELILVPVTLIGRNRTHNASFILDTGASMMIIDHSIALDLGYSVRDGMGFSTVSSAVGKERGYRLQVAGLEALGQKMESVAVACHDLKDQGVEGLLGMTFLKQFSWCLNPKRQVIVVA